MATPENDPILNPAPVSVDGDRARGAGAVGDQLKHARIEQGLTREAVSERTRIKPGYIAALEDGDYAALPALSYAAGFVKNYARLLDLPADELAFAYRAEVQSPAGSLRQANVAVHPAAGDKLDHAAPLQIAQDKSEKMPVLALLALLAICVFAAWAFFALISSRQPVEPEGAVPTTAEVEQGEVAPIETPSRVGAQATLGSPPAPTDLTTQADTGSAPLTKNAQQAEEMAPTVEVANAAGPRLDEAKTSSPGVQSTERSASNRAPVARPSALLEPSPSLPVAIDQPLPEPPDARESVTAAATARDDASAIPATSPIEPTVQDRPAASTPRLPTVIRGGTPPQRGDRRVGPIAQSPRADVEETLNQNSPQAEDVEPEAIRKGPTLAEAQARVPALSSPPNDDPLTVPVTSLERAVRQNQSDVDTQTPSAVLVTPVSEGDLATVIISRATLVRSVPPKFPSRCTSRAKPVEAVEVAFTVSPLGAVQSPSVKGSTNSCFNRAALRSVERWRFNPRLENGRPVESPSRTATVRFER
ncbi:MAG: TonB family protein [Pseudomonadota bacterium]